MEPQQCDRDLVLVTLKFIQKIQKKNLKSSNNKHTLKPPAERERQEVPGESEQDGLYKGGTRQKNRFKLISERDKTHPKA